MNMLDKQKPKFQFYFEFANTYSYLAASRIQALVNATKLPIFWRPFEDAIERANV